MDFTLGKGGTALKTTSFVAWSLWLFLQIFILKNQIKLSNSM